MKILSFREQLSIDFWRPISNLMIHFEANKPYLVSDHQLHNIGVSARPFFQKISDAEPVLRPFRFQAGARDRVLIYNGVGGMGDQIMTWPLAKFLADAGYRVHILCDPHTEFCWQGFRWTETISFVPAYWKAIQAFDHFLCFEHISNSYVHDEQRQPVDSMLWKIGVSPDSIPDHQKVVAPEFTDSEKSISNKLYPGRRLAFYQLTASQQARSLSPKRSLEILGTLCRAYPELYWIGVHGGPKSAEYTAQAIDEPNVEYRSFERVRTLWSLLARAEVCVAPDSMLVHAAGAMGRPCVGLWGTYAPSCRVKYYPRHLPIYHKERCPNSPCNWNSANFPPFCPPSPEPRSRCEVLQGITPEEVVEAVGKLLNEEDLASQEANEPITATL